MHEVRGNVIHSGSRADTDERKPVRRADDAALFVLFRPVLDQRADWHDEKPAKEA